MAKRTPRKQTGWYVERKPGREGGRSVADLATAMEAIAPTWTAAPWDNVGLLVGDAAWPLSRVLLAIDLTPDVLDEAIQGRCDAVVAYHPPVFRAVKQFRPTRASIEGVAAAALANRIAVYSPHTALDASPGGTNDTIAGMAGVVTPVPFEAARHPQPRCKLVVFVPVEHVDAVAQAAFEAGGGRIGDYTECSFRSPGEGTFFGGDSTNPAVGRRGRLERVAEMRLEVVFPRRALSDVISAVRQAHPYEEPAFDVYPLEPQTSNNFGQGRMGMLGRPLPLHALAKQLAERAGVKEISFVGRASESVRRAFICVGAAGSLPFEIPGVTPGPGDVIITGEIRHHDALRIVCAGATAIAMGHWSSERPVLGPLSAQLRSHLPGVSIVVSRRDRNPFGTATLK